MSGDTWNVILTKIVVPLVEALVGGASAGGIVAALLNTKVKLSEQKHTSEDGIREDLRAAATEAQAEARAATQEAKAEAKESRDEAKRWWNLYIESERRHLKELGELTEKHAKSLTDLWERIRKLENELHAEKTARVDFEKDLREERGKRIDLQTKHAEALDQKQDATLAAQVAVERLMTMDDDQRLKQDCEKGKDGE